MTRHPEFERAGRQDDSMRMTAWRAVGKEHIAVMTAPFVAVASVRVRGEGANPRFAPPGPTPMTALDVVKQGLRYGRNPWYLDLGESIRQKAANALMHLEPIRGDREVVDWVLEQLRAERSPMVLDRLYGILKKQANALEQDRNGTLAAAMPRP